MPRRERERTEWPAVPGATRAGWWKRLSHDQRVLYLALLTAVPGVLVALALLWFGEFSSWTRWTLSVLLVAGWIAGPTWMDAGRHLLIAGASTSLIGVALFIVNAWRITARRSNVDFVPPAGR